MNLVVGSGPSGVAAALALLERGQPVTMIDVGRTLEPSFAAAPRELAGRPYEEWPSETRARLAAITGPTINGFPMKTSFGSDFAWRGAPQLMPVETRGAEVLTSFARGGLSNIWGSNVLPFCAEDLEGWPIGPADLEPGYRAVLAHIPVSAERDEELERLLPLHTGRLEPRWLSRQAEAMLGDLRERREPLRARGVRFGASRLGLRTAASAADPGCVRCGLCLHGCPYDLIYSSAHTLAGLERDPRFTYAGGYFATRFRESGAGVELEALRAADRAPARFAGARLFIGGGCFSTTRLVLESLERFAQEVAMLESQYFLIPLLHWRRVAAVPDERLQTLSQLCLRLRDPKVSPRDVHLLLYTYSHLYRAALDRTPVRFVPPLRHALLERLLALQGYLHSDVSPRLAVSLRRNDAGPATLEVEGRKRPETAATVRRVEARVRSLSPLLRASPIPFATRLGPPGKSFHSGGSFPMRRDPGPGDADPLGRPAGLARVHLVDASVFPTIPATNLTLSVMANAYRIAAASCALEPRAGGPDHARAPA
jgi:choline dehydrogenase-like flavoprotein